MEINDRIALELGRQLFRAVVAEHSRDEANAALQQAQVPEKKSEKK